MSRSRLNDALVAWLDAVDRMSLHEDDYVAELVRQAVHAASRGRWTESRRFANSRGRLHGLLALDRVVGSDTLRRMALARLTDAELRVELLRRGRWPSPEPRQPRRPGILARIVGLVTGGAS